MLYVFHQQVQVNWIKNIMDKFQMKHGIPNKFSDDFANKNQIYVGFHGSPMIISWLPLINLAVIIAALRWTKYSFFAHLFLTLIVIGLSLGASIHLLIDYWLNPPNGNYVLKIHMVAGFVMVIWLAVEFITGVMARLIQFPEWVSPNLSYWIKRIHIVLSYGVMLIAKFNYLIIQFEQKDNFSSTFILLLVGDLACLSIYLWIKFSYWTLSEEIIDSQLTIPPYKKDSSLFYKFFQSIVKSLQNIYSEITQNAIKLPVRRQIQTRYNSQSEITLQNYVIFNDYIYDTTKFKWFHPGGQMVIKLVNKRQIDRFMYGFYSLQNLPNTKKQSHTQDSLRLVGPPVAKIIRNPPMKGLIQFAKCEILSCYKIGPVGKTLLVDLKPINTLPLQFEGFESQKQFGQYFSLTIADKKGRKRCTRLYSAIWCMREQNIRFHEKTFDKFAQFTYFNKPRFFQFDLSKDLETYRQQITEKRNETIPLILKRYEKGQFTSRFLNEGKFQGEVVISEPMGAGLRYDKVPEKGLVLIICGGTGFLPFCDLIDMLFKRVTYLQSSHLSETLQRHDPLVNKDIIKQRQFIMYFALQNPQQFPVLTLYQLNELSGSSKINFKTIIRVKYEDQMIKRDFKKISIIKEYFDSQVEEQIKKTNLAQIYICGPPSMNETMVKMMMRNNLDQRIYHIV